MEKTVLVDDLDGTDAEERLTFGLDGEFWEIDLNRGNAEELRTVLARYAKVARPTRLRSGKPKNAVPASPSSRRSPVKPQANGSTPTPKKVREWAQEKGIDVPSKGRLPQTLVDQYLADKS